MKPRSKIRVPRRGMASKDQTSDFDTEWKRLETSLLEIHTKNASNLSFEEMYRSTYHLMRLMRQGPALYDRVCEMEKTWLMKDVYPKIVACITPSLVVDDDSIGPDQVNEGRDAAERFLSKIREIWEDHQLCMGMITDVLMYMDKVMINERRLPSIYNTSMSLFRDHVLRAPIGEDSSRTISSIFESTVLFMIHLEREGTVIDRSLIRHCIYMLEGLYEFGNEDESGKLYFTTFEPAFLEASRRFYLAEGQRLLSTTDASTFCRRVAARISEEEDRTRFMLCQATGPKIQRVLDECLIEKNLGEIIEMEDSGVKYMLDNDRLTDLANVFTLVSRIDPKKTSLTRAVRNRIIELGEKINIAAKEYVQSSSKETGKGKYPEEKPVNLQTAAAIKWVDDVLQLKQKFDKVWEEAFDRDQTMQSAITASFGDFININTRSAEHLSLFFDENLKKGIKGKSEEEVDTVLENGITLLRYIRDKDHFETYYKKHLARRLLLKRSASMDAERQMISKMKMEVGTTFTQRLESMFKDMAISSDLTASYKDHVAGTGEADPKKIDLEVSVLTSTMWPVEIMSSSRNGVPVPQCIFPREIERVKQSFEAFYYGKHSGRKLSWQAGLGTADIRATFVRPDGKVQRHELNVSTYAMVILLLFNDLPPGDSLSFEEIKARTNIPDNDLIRNLQSVAVAPKTRVLRKDPMSKDVNPTDRFFYNNEFTSKFTKLKINVVTGAKVENKDERSETEKKMDDERRHTIEAAIVRIMKQRKTLAHSQLLTEVISQLASRFTPDVNMVKKRIESLIDREYLERISDSDPPSYQYLA
ncbi:hypothetical protein VTO42DRAFT_255 [Malbranchea cinnamomea]